MKISYYYNPLLKKVGDNYSLDIYMYKNGERKIIKTITGGYCRILLLAGRIVNHLNKYGTGLTSYKKILIEYE